MWITEHAQSALCWPWNGLLDDPRCNYYCLWIVEVTTKEVRRSQIFLYSLENMEKSQNIYFYMWILCSVHFMHSNISTEDSILYTILMWTIKTTPNIYIIKDGLIRWFESCFKASTWGFIVILLVFWRQTSSVLGTVLPEKPRVTEQLIG